MWGDREGRGRACSLATLARNLAVSLVSRHRRGPMIVVTPDDGTARRLAQELIALEAGGERSAVVRLPALDADPYRGMPAHTSVAAQRVAVLDRLAAGEPLVLVLPAEALLVPVPPLAELQEWGWDITRESILDLDRLALWVVSAGYRVVDVVGAPGDFAKRGGLFDVWPPQEESPLRVELFGDEVDTIRRFDSATQRTVCQVPSFRLLPAREAPIGPEQADHLLDGLMGRARAVLAEAEATPEGLPRLLKEMLAGLEGAPGLYRENLVSLLDLLPTQLLVWEPEAVNERIESRWSDWMAAWQEQAGDRLPPPETLFCAPSGIRARLDQASLVLSEMPLADDRRRLIDLEARPASRYEGGLERLVGDLRHYQEEGRPVIVMTRTAGNRRRLAEVFSEHRFRFRKLTEEARWRPEPGEILLAEGEVQTGADFGLGEALVFSESDLFGEAPPPPPSRRRRGGEAFLSDLRDLKLNDLVVHIDHGIGRYVGLGKRPVTGEELLILEYAAGDKLYVPVSRLDLIQKYSGGERPLVPLDRLGGPGWDRRRRRVRQAVAQIAEELLALYAKRKAVRAPQFSSDQVWQQEFEAAFPHEMTPDQAGALADIKSDLGVGKAMDRLLCGDVGFGKTEVALRAAFKAVQEGFQVAVLAPTTVLAFQHLNTIRARMASWPVRVEMVSRFVPPPEAKKILASTRTGEVDILIGTHRLLSQDVGFRRLGLLIVDEEQRFGVRHKEKIKHVALGVHSLTLTATPIPRTLQMSLAGVRDLSVIETPPRNRLAIQTHLAPWSPSLVAAAMRNELRRGGQIYFITPRVEGIEGQVADLRELVPEARIAYAHGQMPENQLERVMLAFIRGEVDVLVATTIIENGLDIPRANTIIIKDAHFFGLSQLYQMRGRVGRSDQRAYAYLLIPPRRELKPDARRRLAALVEFTELGSGFRIAALDLEIRGAGEFLGARQSGHIAAVGFDLYAQMLEEAVRRQVGQPLPESREPVAINLGLASFLPEDYLPEAGQRLALYKRLSAAENPLQVQNLLAETEDRFGRLPEPARCMFRIAELRIAAEAQGAVAVDWTEDAVAIRYGERPKVDPDKILAMVRRDPDVRLTPTGVVRLRVSDPQVDRIAMASLALRKLAP